MVDRGKISGPSPYIWVTWLSKSMVGENSCEYSGWFKTHYQNYEKVPNAFDLASWQVEHITLLSQTRGALELDGKTGFTEEQNKFTLKGSTAKLGGKPDLITVSAADGTIHDVKTGKPNPSHQAPVLIYMYAVPRAFQRYHGMQFDGRLIYPDHEEAIPHAAVDDGFNQKLAQLISRVSSEIPAGKVPSPMECQFCELTSADCPDRLVADPGGAGETDDL